MKAIIEALLPPILHPRYKDNHRFRKIYKSYEDAYRDCSENGYENEEIVDIVYLKTKSYIQNKTVRKIGIQELAIAQGINQFLMENPVQKSVNVLDFGGACGLHYFELRSLFPSNIKLNWAVVETTEMAKKGKDIQNIAGGELHFFDDLDVANQHFNGGGGGRFLTPLWHTSSCTRPLVFP